ncbi:asparagine synthase-related protein [Haloflavibacter putidus]|uniref:asparagine synthase (glutamine-hydrolyzing) n=1 Tax=Haloflavibacter putidus TaxID=2576776 RepID=A0A507ZUZ0_9FLAO|nr:asparagine synthase-related protein [Haloflavibacter putidus]TQD40757.1 hypothetical protein FKR84_01895 [Haloflavibacter putidus]
MAGIYGVLLKNNHQKDICNNFYNSKFKNTVQEEITYKDFRFGRSVLNKFQQDRFFYENENYLICFEGINYSSTKTPKEIIAAYEERGDFFIEKVKGNFSCFLYDKRQQSLKVYTDPLASKSIYYFYDKKHGFAFASEMHVLSKLLREHKIPITYDYDGIYSLALYGQMFKEYTLVREIKRLSYGSVLNYFIDDKILEKHQYYKFKKKQVSLSKKEIINQIDDLMLSAVKREWDKDEEYAYTNKIALISGGMDSRVNALLADKLNYQSITGYTFGNPNSSDVKIASDISKNHFQIHLQTHLYNGKFFTQNILENYIKSNDGLVHFTPSSIIYNVYKNINFSGYGQIHSGQIGDALFGSLLKPNFSFKQNKDKIGLTGFIKHLDMIKKIKAIDDILEEFELSDYELFAYQERVVNGALTGDKQINNFIDHSSPFFDTALINFMLSVPNKFKINQQIYFDWLKDKHPEILNYKWEKIGLKPNTNFKINYGRYIKKYVNGGKKYFGLKYDSMNPIANWLQNDKYILQEFDKLFKENLPLINNAELKQDLEKIYSEDIFEYRNRFAVLTVVLAIKLHFES